MYLLRKLTARINAEAASGLTGMIRPTLFTASPAMEEKYLHIDRHECARDASGCRLPASLHKCHITAYRCSRWIHGASSAGLFKSSRYLWRNVDAESPGVNANASDCAPELCHYDSRLFSGSKYLLHSATLCLCQLLWVAEAPRRHPLTRRSQWFLCLLPFSLHRPPEP